MYRKTQFSKKQSATIIGVFILVFAGLAGVIAISQYLDPERRLLAEANSLDAQGNYAAAIDKYQQLIQSYPYGKYNYDAEVAKLNSYNNLVSQLISDKKYDDAITKWFVVRDEYSSYFIGPKNDTILSTIPADTLLNHANELQRQNITLAYRLYDLILQYYPNTPAAVEAQDATITLEIEQMGQGSTHINPYSTSQADLGGTAEVVIINDSPEALKVLISGPDMVKEVSIPASPGSSYYSSFGSYFHIGDKGGPPADAQRATLTLQPGDFKMIIRTNSAGSLYSTESFNSNERSTYWVYIERTVIVP